MPVVAVLQLLVEDGPADLEVGHVLGHGLLDGVRDGRHGGVALHGAVVLQLVEDVRDLGELAPGR